MALYVGHFDFARPLLWTVPDLLTGAECDEVVALAAASVWQPATVNRQQGRQVDARLRDSDTAVLPQRRRSEHDPPLLHDASAAAGADAALDPH